MVEMTMQDWKRSLAATLAAAAVLGTTACGSGEQRPKGGKVSEIEKETETGSETSSGSSTASASGSETATLPFTESEATAVVTVELDEWSVVANPTTVKAGKIYFKIVNNGAETHELVVTKTGATDEEGALAERAGIGAKTTGELALELQPGKYQLACFIVEKEHGETENHFEEGMATEFVVE